MTLTGRARLCGALAILLAAGCTTTPGEDRSPTPRVDDSTSIVTPSPTATGPSAREVLSDPGLAGSQPADTLRAMVRDELAVDGGWQDRVAADLASWPVYVGTARMEFGGRVRLDVLVSVPAQDDDELVLRWLPSATALGDAVETLEIRVDGRATSPAVDRDGARIRVPVPTGRAATIRVHASYTVPRRDTVTDDGSPAGYGLLARTDGVVSLGHWLPLVTLETDDGPMLGRGDVGGFPAAAFSIRVAHPGTLVSGGLERPCPGADRSTDRSTDCTWLRGLGVRDVSAVLLSDPVREATGAGTDTAVVHVPASAAVAARLGPVTDQAAAGLDVLTDALGPLPWSTVDVVAVPISPGALGMEFPGMVWIDPGAWPEDGPGLGAYVLAHELAHQWFHALVGNGSLSSPVVDESLAQYLSVVVFDEVFRAGAGDELAASSLGGRHDRALADGVPDERPGRSLDAFSTARSYGAAVYGRGGQAWVDAEAAAGREVVLAALRDVVDRYGLRVVAEEEVLEVVSEVAPRAGRVVRAGWGR